ncbi:unnamed protein product [Ophioblennius macclurei]
MLSSQIQTCRERCSSEHFSTYEHCGICPDGVGDLDCFSNYKSKGSISCTWKAGNHTSKTNYTVVLRQQDKLKEYCCFWPNVDGSSKIFNFLAHERLNLTVEVFERSEAANCTKAVFQGSPSNLTRCGPPKTATFSRVAGALHVSVNWPQADIQAIKKYNVRYKTVGSRAWSESPVASEDRRSCRLDTLNSSLVYFIQIRCVSNKKCSQCPWSETHTVPTELTTQPIIVEFQDKDNAKKKGSRHISVTWKFPGREPYDGYHVTAWKASGETPPELTITAQPRLKLVLSYSSYRLNISAFNNASVSPAVSLFIPRRDDTAGVGDGRVNVTVHHNKSFTVAWKDDLVKSYVCYSVEWRENEREIVHMSFHVSDNNYRTLFPLPEPLKPYRRYNITLHTRTNKDTCNMVHVNNTESTYGSTQFYSVEGPPVRAPTNISASAVTTDSAVLRWSCIPEEDIRGFLLGYIIHYMENHDGGTRTETNVTVDPTLNSFELTDLKIGTAYQVQMSGFTSAGAGVRSAASFFRTKHKGRVDLGLIVGFVVIALVLICGSPVIKRVRVILWPSIPTPKKSNAMQKMERTDDLELTEAVSILNVDEWDVKSLHVLEREAASPAIELMPLNPSDDEEDSLGRTSGWAEEDTDAASRDVSSGDPKIFLDTQQTNAQVSAFAFTSGYTTVEMFQQSVNEAAAPDVEEKCSPDPESTTVIPGPGYMRQVSNGPASDSEYTVL